MRKHSHRTLFIQVLVGVAAGIFLGYFYPSAGAAMRPVSDGFIKILRLFITPIVFVVVAGGIGSLHDLRKVGRAGLKALIYFEVVTTGALILGLLAVHVMKPGVGLNVNPATLDAGAVSSYVKAGKQINAVDFTMGIIPAGIAEPFVENEMLQVLFLAILTGAALSHLGPKADVLQRGLDQATKALFTVVGYVMKLAPVAAFGAMAFTIGQYGLHSLVALASLAACLFLADGLFIALILGFVCFLCRINLWAFLRYIREEIMIVLATATSELAFPSLMRKLEHLGCSKTMVGFLLPAGYTFNLDGSSIYLSVAFVFLAQATNTHMSLGQELLVLGIMLLTSKGAAGVAGAAFIVLAATLASVHSVPLAALTLLLGINRFLSEAGSVTNMIGNAVATIVISKWEDNFDSEKARRVLSGADPFTDIAEDEATESNSRYDVSARAEHFYDEAGR